MILKAAQKRSKRRMTSRVAALDLLLPVESDALRNAIDTPNSAATPLCMGRHKLPDDERKSEVFRLSVTAAQHAAIEKAARAAG